MKLEDLIRKIEGIGIQGEDEVDLSIEEDKLIELFNSYKKRHIEVTKNSKAFNSDIQPNIVRIAYETVNEIYEFFRVKEKSEKYDISIVETIQEMAKVNEWSEDDELGFLRRVSHGKLIFHQLVFPIIVEHFIHVFDLDMNVELSEEELKDRLNDSLRDLKDKDNL